MLFSKVYENNFNISKNKIFNFYFSTFQIYAVSSWDSSVHDSELLNRVTSSNDRIYLIVKVVVRLSHPAYMELVLRKRVCINIYNSLSFTSLTGKLKQKITGTVSVTQNLSLRITSRLWHSLCVPGNVKEIKCIAQVALLKVNFMLT